MEFRLSDDWQWVPLGSVVRIGHGFAFDGQNFTKSGVDAIVTPGNFFEGGGFRTVGGKQRFYSGPYPSSYLLSGNELIVVMTEQAQGLLGSTAFVPESGRWLHNQRIGLIRFLGTRIEPQFLFHYCNGPAFRAAVSKTAAGTKVRHTSPKKLEEIEIPLPSLSEQAAIGGALTDADLLISAIQDKIAKKRLMKRGVMHRILTGRQRLPGFFEPWLERRVGDVASITKGTQLGRAAMDANQPVPVWNGGVEPSGFTGFANVHRPVVTVSEGGNSCGWVGRPESPIWLGGHCYALEPKSEGHSVAFLYHRLKSLEDKIMDLRVGSGLPNIQKKRLSEFTLSVPANISEASAIATVLDDLDEEIEALDARLTKARAVKAGMVQQLLTGRIRLQIEVAA